MALCLVQRSSLADTAQGQAHNHRPDPLEETGVEPLEHILEEEIEDIVVELEGFVAWRIAIAVERIAVFVDENLASSDFGQTLVSCVGRRRPSSFVAAQWPVEQLDY